MIPALERLLRQQIPAFAQARIDLVKLHNGMGFRNPKVSFVAFIDSVPQLFLKSVRFPSDNAIIERAHDRLRRAQEAVREMRIQAHVPEAAWMVFEGMHRVCAETMIAGRPLDRTSAVETSRAFEWLDAYAAHVSGSTCTGAELHALLERSLAEMRSTDAEFLSETRLTFDRLLSQAGGDALRLPLIPAHGDFTPSNLLMSTQGELGIIDWDRYGDIQIPLFDVLTLAERVSSKNQNMLLRAKMEILRHSASLNIDVTFLPLLIFFYMLLSDWRKRERMFSWEPASWDRDALVLFRRMLADAKDAFAW